MASGNNGVQIQSTEVSSAQNQQNPLNTSDSNSLPNTPKKANNKKAFIVIALALLVIIVGVILAAILILGKGDKSKDDSSDENASENTTVTNVLPKETTDINVIKSIILSSTNKLAGKTSIGGSIDSNDGDEISYKGVFQEMIKDKKVRVDYSSYSEAPYYDCKTNCGYSVQIGGVSYIQRTGEALITRDVENYGSISVVDMINSNLDSSLDFTNQNNFTVIGKSEKTSSEEKNIYKYTITYTAKDATGFSLIKHVKADNSVQEPLIARIDEDGNLLSIEMPNAYAKIAITFTETDKVYTIATPDAYTGWKTYTGSGFSFKYPNTWKVLITKPNISKYKMFDAIRKCTVYIQNIKDPNFVIVADLSGEGESGWCYSYGTFTESDVTRQSFAKLPLKEINANKWSLPQTTQTVPTWDGVYVEDLQNNAGSVVLVYQAPTYTYDVQVNQDFADMIALSMTKN